MRPLDIRYLELQFLERVYNLSGTEFQSFVEGILGKKFEGFEKVRPYGNLGDGGNDGFRKEDGIYYQVYAPLEPSEKDATAASKMREDFEKLHKNWNDISKIKEYNFVFNDKFRGTTSVIDKALAKLKKDYPTINFNLVLTSTLKKLLLSLDEASLLSLHFDIDTRTAQKIATSILDLAMTEIDREKTDSALRILRESESLVFELLDPSIKIKHTVLTARCFQQNEELEQADTVLTKLVADNQGSVEALLAAADMKLAREDYDENSRLLAIAEKIDGQSSQLAISKLLRKVNLNEPVKILDSDKNTFLCDARKLSSYYKLISISLVQKNDIHQAKEFLEEAIDLNPNRLSCHLSLLELAAIEAGNLKDQILRKAKLEETLEDIEGVVENFGGQESLVTRSKVYLNRLRADIYASLSDEHLFVTTATIILKDCQECYLDKGIEYILVHILGAGRIKKALLNDVCNYIKKTSRGIGAGLSKALITQFSYNEILSDVGVQFFNEIGQEESIQFISKYENQEFEYLVEQFNEDPAFGVMFIDSVGKYSNEIGELIDELNLEDFYKQRLKFHLYCGSSDFVSAFEIVKLLDFESLGPFEIEDILQVANKFDAWDIEIFLLNRLLVLRGDNAPPGTKLRLFDASLRAKKYTDAVKIGTELLESENGLELLDGNNRTIVFNNVLLACNERGKIDDKYIDKALKLINDFERLCADFNSRISYIPEILSANEQSDEAYDSIVAAVVESEGLSLNDYARLFVPVCIRMGESLNQDRFNLNEVEDNSFVYLEQSNQWYRIGDETPLDAIAINTESPKYDKFLGAKIGSSVNVSPQFGLEEKTETIAKIFTVAGYVYERIRDSFQKLSNKDLVPHVKAVQIKEKDGEIDLKHFAETIALVTGTNDALFELYQNGTVPFAFFATQQGGFGQGLGKIVSEEIGYINFSSGMLEDFNSQVSLAENILSDDSTLYIDGTSAVFLAEFGLFERVMKCLANVKVPQSVVNLLADLADTFKERIGSTGSLAIKKGDPVFHEHDPDKLRKIRDSLIEALQMCEERTGCVELLSNANKSDDFIERELLSGLVDASILARRNKSIVLTDDYLYLRAAEAVLGYEVLPFTSSVALVRAMYQLGHISFEEYIRYFAFVSGYRFRFLPVSPLDVEKAVLGDELIKEVNARNIEYFNFKLTLSQKYGVSEQECIRVLSIIHFNFMIDNSISENAYERIVIEIINSLPDNQNKLKTIDHIHSICEINLKKLQENKAIHLNYSTIRSKLSRLESIKLIYV